MQTRRLGKTDLDVSIIGFGGFHLVETTFAYAQTLLGTYLDNGGSYVETAAGYGDGNSERKIGDAVAHRRDDFVLATKCHARDAKGARELLERSLRNLKTDHIDIWFMHAIQTDTDLDAILGEDGALAEAERARQEGQVRFVGITGHGRQRTMAKALDLYDIDVIMTGFNYLDRFNFPETEEILLPKALDKDVGVLAMKPIADGFLYRSWKEALRYTLSLPTACAVTGANTFELLEADIAEAERFQPMTDADRERLFRAAPELGDYVCRQCNACRSGKLDPQAHFLLEGLYDRQMDDRRVPGTADYALRERLKHWFQQRDTAKDEYATLVGGYGDGGFDPDADYSHLNRLCSYGIDIDRKLKIVHDKLSSDDYEYRGA